MTNVPQDLREMWADVYRLFDANYLLENTKEGWDKFWHDGGALMAKYRVKYPLISEMVMLTARMIEERIKRENNTFTAIETETLF